MPSRYECLADVRDGEIVLPGEIASRLRARGVVRVRLIMTSELEESEALRERGIDAEVIARTARAQGYDQDVAMTALMGEGTALGGSSEARLRALLSDDR